MDISLFSRQLLTENVIIIIKLSTEQGPGAHKFCLTFHLKNLCNYEERNEQTNILNVTNHKTDCAHFTLWAF